MQYIQEFQAHLVVVPACRVACRSLVVGKQMQRWSESAEVIRTFPCINTCIMNL
jgi:hypothetical protein